MIPDDDNPELTKFMVAMRFAGHGDFATLPREERQARVKAMIQDISIAFAAAVEIMAMDKAQLIERRAWDKPLKVETLATVSKAAQAVHQIMEAAAARVMCAMAELADA